MKKKLLLFITLFSLFGIYQNAKAQTVSPGDIAFIGYQTGTTTDGFSFITLKPISAGTIIYFTDRGWNGTTWVSGSTEPHLRWIVPSLTPAGTIVSVVETSADIFTVNGTSGLGFAPGFTTFNLAGGDQMLAYQSASGPEPVSPNQPTFIAGVHGDYNELDYDPLTTWNNYGTAGGNYSALPTGLTNGLNCISLFPAPGPEIANSKYTGTLTGTSADLLLSINNPANWGHHATSDLVIIPSGYAVPNVSLVVAPTVTTASPTIVRSVSAILGGEVTADGGDADIERGIVWATTANPTISNNKFQIGTGTGTFSGNVTGFPAGTLIHYRAYATNDGGTSYGADMFFTTGAALSAPATISKTDVSCNGGGNGTATIIATGGSIPYTYSWSPSGGTNATATGLSVGPYTVTVTDAELTQITRSITLFQPSALVTTPSQTNVTCNGAANGTATVTASGGTPGYTYLWSTGATTATITGLIPNTYSVTVTDGNGCPKTENYTITQPSVLNANATKTDVSCNGGGNGTATVVASGGAGGYTYSWAPSGGTNATATGLTAGTYTVTVTDANLCTQTATVTVNQPTAALSATTTKTNVSCNGGANGTATVNVTGGTSSYTYSWAPSGGTSATATGLIAGTYTVTVTDANACQTTASVTINQPAVLDGIAFTTPISCNLGSNGTATISPIGGTAGYTYLWSTGATTATITGLTAGTYSVEITDANTCTKNITNILVGNATPIAANLSISNVLCNGGANGTASVLPSGGAGGYTYLWSTGATTSSITGLAAGNYSVDITDSNTCVKTENFTITQPPALVASQGIITNVSCNGGANGTAAVSVTGGAPGYTYSWAPSGGTASTASGLAAGTYTVTVTDANACQATQSFTISEPSSLSVTPSQTNILCNGSATGSASVTVTGGTPGYTYSWAPAGGTAATATGLTAGTYTVTITDANLCSTTETITITEPAALVVSPVAQTNIACFGDSTGSATVNVTGGTGSYTYLWSPSGGTAATANGLSVGTNTVTVTDANGCQKSQAFTISQPAASLSATTSSTGVSCNGGANGTASVTPLGGTPGYTYSWAPSGGTAATAIGLAAGNYTCTITDANGCIYTANATVSTPAPFSATISKTDVSCNSGANGTATITASGATAPYTYSWAPYGGTAATATGLSAGTYTVTVQDNNTCIYQTSVTIDQPNVLSVIPSQNNVLCNGGATGTATVNVSGGTSNYTYLWSPSGGTAPTATGLAIGTYTCLVTDSNGCSITQSFTITEPPLLTAATSQVDATCTVGGEASVLASGGTTPYSYLWSDGQTTATASGLTAGNHTVLITDSNGCTITRNFTISTTNTLVATTSQTDVLCNGSNTGSATVVPSGAVGPFTYVWAPTGGNTDTATGLAAGNYSVTITAGNGCSIVKNFTINEPTALTVTPSQTNILCNGSNTGQASVSVTGGTGAYTYLWAPSGGTAATATGLTAGNYTVTITDANLCEKTQNFTITEPTAITITTNQTDVVCNGQANGTVTATVTGGTGAYTYIWAPSGGTAATASGLIAGTYTITITDANACTATQTVTITEPDILTAVTSQTNVLCNNGTDGTATVTVTGGTGAYTYLWAPSGGTAATATGLAAGTYTVTVTDANLCSTTETITITEPSALSISKAQTDILCKDGNDGTATVTVTGGTGAYTYLWAPSGGIAATATDLTAGTYTVTVTDANACTLTETFTITEPTALTATLNVNNVTCYSGNNGSASVTVSGGTGVYTYLWSSGGSTATETGLTAGTYTVTVTDANLCEKTESFTITEPNEITIVPAQTNVLCKSEANGTATVTVTGGTGAYTYLWTPSGGTAATATGLTAGTYTVTVKDANLCEKTQSFTITEPDALAITLSKTDVLCKDGNDATASVTVTGGTGAYTYLWAPSGGTAATATGLTAGTYTVTVTDANSCFVTETFTITEPTALTATVNVNDVTCYNGNNGSASVTVLGGTGAYTYLWSSGETTSTITGLVAGTYTVTITDTNSCSIAETALVLQPATPVTLTTASASTITVLGASVSGTASSDGINTDQGSCLTEVGFVYSLNANPTINDTKINSGNTLGTFTANLSGLRGNRTYFVRSYAINSNGFVNYGNEISFTTQKYTLNITAAAHTKVYGTADPVFTFNALGFENGDNNSILSGLLSRDTGENVGIYNINAGTINAGADYVINFTGATFEITKADQTITWSQSLNFGCSDSSQVTFTATTDSGLPVSYSIANTSIGTISGSTLNITGSGSSTITASQSGDQNHNAAVSIVKNIEVSQSGLVVQQWADVLFFDNKSNNYVSYQWYKNGAAVSGATRQYYNENPLNGTYYVIAKDKNGNSVKSCPIEVSGTIFTKKLKIYPNPVRALSEFTLECDFSESQLNGAQINIYDITGKIVQTVSDVKAENKIIAPAQNAIYVIVLKLSNGQLKTINLLVK